MESKLATLQDIAGKQFDFVIIGGGTAGLCLAHRLTENPNVTVAVLEAGNPHIHDPMLLQPHRWPEQLMNPEYDWAFMTVPQKYAGGTEVLWNRGKGLGGSSGMNLLVWTRPQVEEIDAIEKLGNPGWNWKRYYEYSKKSEKFYPPTRSSNGQYRDLYDANSIGNSGPIPLSFTQTVTNAEYPFQQSLGKLGARILSDALGGDTNGTYKAISDIDIKTGTRGYATPAYLLPVIDRPNLKVLTDAYVRKIVTHDEGRDVVAEGVEFEHEGKVYRVHAAKEVILSAGTVKSPQVLELSGIGDRAILEPLGIPVKKHLPGVGTNVQDHVICTAMAFEMREDANIYTSDLLKNPKYQAKYLAADPKMDAAVSLCMTGITFLPIQTVSERPDAIIEKMAKRISNDGHKLPPGFREQYEVVLENLKNPAVPDIEIMIFPFNPTPDEQTKPMLMVLPTVGRPFSRGTIHVKSTDPKEAPIVDPRYFVEDTDLDILVDAWKFTRKATQTEPFRSLVVAEVVPGPAVTNESDIREIVRKNITTVWHACGSCSMLPEEKNGVVDDKLRVYGTKKLRVVDLSVVPLEVSVHTQSIVYAVTEMAADIIKKDHGIQHDRGRPRL